MQGKIMSGATTAFLLFKCKMSEDAVCLQSLWGKADMCCLKLEASLEQLFNISSD